MKITKNIKEDSSSFEEIWGLIEGKTIKSMAVLDKEFQIGLNDDYMLRISGNRVNLVRTKNPPDKWQIWAVWENYE